MISERRLHVAAAFGHALHALRELAVPIVIGIVVGGRGLGTTSLLFGAAGVVASATMGWLRWRTTTYRVSERALHVRSGVFSPDDTVVPLDRVQAVDVISGPIQRLFGITGLHVQTPGGGEQAEVELPALSAAPSPSCAARSATPRSRPRAPRRCGWGCGRCCSPRSPRPS